MGLSSERRLMCVLAHPDDESLGTGGALADAAAAGVATYLVTATRGERGRLGHRHDSPEVVGAVRSKTAYRADRWFWPLAALPFHPLHDSLIRCGNS